MVDGAAEDDNKLLLLRAEANWFERWQALQGRNSQMFTLTKQTCSALVKTLWGTASFIKYLLSRNHEYVLTSRFQAEPLELRFPKYRQISSSRFLIGLREVELWERVLLKTSLLKESFDILGKDLRKKDIE